MDAGDRHAGQIGNPFIAWFRVPSEKTVSLSDRTLAGDQEAGVFLCGDRQWNTVGRGTAGFIAVVSDGVRIYFFPPGIQSQVF